MKWTAKMYFRDHVLIMLVLTKAKCYKPRNSNMSESAFFEQQIACVWYFCIAKQFFRTFPFITLTFATRGAIFCYNDEKAPQFSLFSLLLLAPLAGVRASTQETSGWNFVEIRQGLSEIIIGNQVRKFQTKIATKWRSCCRTGPKIDWCWGIHSRNICVKFRWNPPSTFRDNQRKLIIGNKVRKIQNKMATRGHPIVGPVRKSTGAGVSSSGTSVWNLVAFH